MINNIIIAVISTLIITGVNSYTNYDNARHLTSIVKAEIRTLTSKVEMNSCFHLNIPKDDAIGL